MNHLITAGLLLAALCSASANTRAEDERKIVVQIGAAAAIAGSLHDGADTDLNLFPLLIVESGHFYFRGLQIGYRLVERGNTSLAIQLEYATEGYQSGDSDALAGMRTRRAAWESGFVLSRQLAQGQLELKLMHDVSGTHDGYSAEVNYERVIRTTSGGTTSAFLTGELYDAKKVDYYFGVREAESTAGRAAFQQSSTTGASVGVNHVQRLGERFALIGSIGYRAFDDDISLSPIVDKNWQIRAYAGFTYQL